MRNRFALLVAAILSFPACDSDPDGSSPDAAEESDGGDEIEADAGSPDSSESSDAGTTDGAPADATLAAFDFAYLSAYELDAPDDPGTTKESTMYGVGAVVNTGPTWLDTTAIEIVSTSSDHPDVEVRAELQAWSGPNLEPGHAVGGLNAVAQDWVLPLIDEPFELGQPVLRTVVAVHGPVNAVVSGTITIALEGAVVVLPLSLDIATRPGDQGTVILAADRLSSTP
jgi:hypothetical protein